MSENNAQTQYLKTPFAQANKRTSPQQTNFDEFAKATDSDSESQKSEPAVMSVEQLNGSIKKILEGQFDLIWVQGEVSNFKAHTSGHYYFSLKDKKSQISAVMFRGYNSKLKFRVEDGLEVIVRGRISVYEPRGNYQILCEMMEPVGAGALQKAFEQLKAKLKQEGLFELSKKRPIPPFPSKVAVVTSPTGAAIQDILNVLSRRAPHVEVFVVPTIVQGSEAAPKIREAFLQAQKIPNLDVMIVGCGGGSIEDMWCFNDEELARLIAKSQVPVISAVGHEIDFTICDFVADLRAPTPSAAAELVAKSTTEAVRQVQDLQRHLQRMIQDFLHRTKMELRQLTVRMVDPKKKMEDLRLRHDDLLGRLEFASDQYLKKQSLRIEILRGKMTNPHALVQRMEQKRQFFANRLSRALAILLQKRQLNLQRSMSLLDSLSPLKVVERGYSILEMQGTVVRTAEQLTKGDRVQARIATGKIELEYIGAISNSSLKK